MARLIHRAIDDGSELDDRLLARSARLDGFMRPSAQERILSELAGRPDNTAHGSDLAEALGMPNGTLYPALDAMAKKGWLTVTQEDGDARQHKRGVRKFATLTTEGKAALDGMSMVSLRADAQLAGHLRVLAEIMSTGEAMRARERAERVRRIRPIRGRE